MKAFVISGINEYGIKDIEKPRITSQEVLVKLKANGICYSDYDLIDGEYMLPFDYPVIPGHEWAGEIVEVGKDVVGFKIGDRVVGECAYGCGICSICQSGNFAYCPDGDHFGFTVDGALAEYFKVKPELLHKIPDDMDYRLASLIEPFSIAYNAIYRPGGIDAADTTVIVGGGTIGLCGVAAAVSMGSKTILVEPIKFKREIAEKLGAIKTIDPLTEDAPSIVKEMTNGLGADLVLEVSGNSNGLKQTFDLVKNSGRISFTGINFDKNIPTKLGDIQMKGLNIYGNVGSPYVWDRVIDYLTNSKLDLSPIRTHEFKFEESKKAYDFFKDPKNKTVKITIVNE